MVVYKDSIKVMASAGTSPLSQPVSSTSPALNLSEVSSALPNRTDLDELILETRGANLIASKGAFPDAWNSFSAADGRPMPVFTQTGQRWSSQRYPYSSDPSGSGPTIAESGCGVVSLAMVLSWAHGKQISPDVVAQKLVAAGGHVSQGTTWDSMVNVARGYGYSAQRVDNPTHDQISAALRTGPVIIMGPNGRNHIMVIVDQASEGFYKTVDPFPANGRSTGVGGVGSVQGMIVIRR